MTSRRLFRLALGIAALPLVLEATSGCTHDVGTNVDVEADDAYLCECELNGESRQTHTLVDESADDAEEEADGTVVIDDADLDLGDAVVVGLRFADAMIPPGATIVGAYVQFTAEDDADDVTDLEIHAVDPSNAGSFLAVSQNISGRMGIGPAVAWDDVPAWTAGEAGPSQRTPDLAPLLQALVATEEWSNASPVVLRIQGTGDRDAEPFDAGNGRAPRLVVDFSPRIVATLPICAPHLELDDDHQIEREALKQDCEAEGARVAKALDGMAETCGYPTGATCTVVEHRPGDFSWDASQVCTFSTCDPVDLEASCSNFDPDSFVDCVATGGSGCEDLISANRALGDDPVCVASGSPLAFQLFGQRSTCEITEGVSEIEVGEREPKKDPQTRGTVEFLGRPCPGESCSVGAYLQLAMDPITFDVKFHSDPVFRDLNASGHSLLGAALLDGAGAGAFPEFTIDGAGSGRRGSTALTVESSNDEPLAVVVDWSARRCDLDGNLGAVVDGEEGTCAGDGVTRCNADSPDCDVVGGPCEFAEDAEQMSVILDVAGDLVNQPPRSVAGADQTIECTSTAGAAFALDGRGSTDPDANLAIWSWRAGSRIGPEVGIDPVLGGTLDVGAAQTYVLRVIDAFAQADEDETAVAVVDTTPPEIACNAPATVTPPDAPISFAATATDTCDTQVLPEVLGFDCFTFTKKGRRIDKRESCEVSFLGDTLAIVDVGGVGDQIAWTVRGTDDSGNASTVECALTVVNPSR
jgi:hypothetical protein